MIRQVAGRGKVAAIGILQVMTERGEEAIARHTIPAGLRLRNNAIADAQRRLIEEEIAPVTTGLILHQGNRIQHGAAANIKTATIIIRVVLANRIVQQGEIAPKVMQTSAGACLIVVHGAALHG